MADIPVDIDVSGTIFVDVSTGQQFPISEFSQILEPQPVKSEVLETSEKPGDVQETNDAQSQNSKPTEFKFSDVPQRIRCPECQRYTAETEEKMVRHIRKMHRGENPFQCYMCDYSTYNKSLFEEHVRIHQGIKPFKCSHCPYRSASKKNTKKHELIHRPDNPLKCPDCEFIARNPRALDSHKMVHSDVKFEDVGNAKRCPDCLVKFSSKEHTIRHRKDRRRCKRCMYVACTRRLLKAHMVSEHNIEFKDVKRKEKILFSCSRCSWSSGSKPRILLHLIHHPNQKVDESVIDVTVLRQCGIEV